MKGKIKKELREWIVLLSVGGFIYLMGWHTFLIGKLQQAVLYTGILSPSEISDKRVASYDFKLETLDGTEVHFSEFENKTVFINFWATWCPPCIAEMPDIQSLYDETNGDVSYVMISLDQDENKAREFVKKRGFSFPIYFMRSSLPKTYNTHAIPTTYLIDKTGMIKVENHGMAKYNSSKFKKILKEAI